MGTCNSTGFIIGGNAQIKQYFTDRLMTIILKGLLLSRECSYTLELMLRSLFKRTQC